MAAQIIFWIAVGMLFYIYLGYPLLLGLLVAVKGKPKPPEDGELPRLTVLVVAFNEEQGIIRKIENILGNGYPDDKIEIIVCSDGSTDDTNRLVEEYGDPRVRLVASPENIGVNGAFALGAREATGEVQLMTDSGGSLYEPGAILKAARYFTDPKVGFVSGNIMFENPNKSAIGSGYRSYWSVETQVRQMESHLGLLVVTVGIFEMIRRDAYLPIPSEFANDMAAPFYACSLGYKARYETEALAIAQQRKTPGQDLARRIRMAVRGWSSLPFLRRHVPMLRNVRLWGAMLSHKYFRWCTAIFLVAALVANAFLLDTLLYQITFAGQAFFYGLALIGWLLAIPGRRLQPFSLCFYFCLLQIAGLVGMVQALMGKRIGTWKPVAD